MQLEIDSLGASPRPFEELRDELIKAGKKFDAEALSHIPYEKLAQCATGIAGSAMCSILLVREEKKMRRTRFCSMSEAELRDSKVLLQVEQMDDDITRERARSRAPKWESLRPRQQAWFKLNCIANHLDGVADRMREAIALLQLVQETHDLPDDFIRHQRKKLEVLLQIYPLSLTDLIFHRKIIEICLDIKKLLPDDEQRICEAEVLFNYSCSSDCYCPLV
jgi:hypothetical protein